MRSLHAHDSNGPSAKPHAMPADGLELERRLAAHDTKLAEQGLWTQGDLLNHVLHVVSRAGPKPGYGSEVARWPESAIALAVQEAKAFEQTARKKEERRRASEERLTAPQGHA